jgi:hypothetical protein
MKWNYEKDLSEKIKNGEIIFLDEYKFNKCPQCECKYSRVLYTPQFRHHAKLECRDCGMFFKWLKKTDCKLK